MNLPKQILVLSVALLHFASGFAEDEFVEIKAGFPEEFPPHYSLSGSGKAQGFAVDLLNAIAREANLSIDYIPYSSWSDAHTALKQGEIDVIPNMGIIEERKSFADFTSPIETFNVSVFVRSGSFNTIADLKGKRIGVIQKNIGVKLIKQYKEIDGKLFDNFSAALFEVISGNIDGVIYPDPVAWKVIQKAGLEDKFSVIRPPLIEIKRGVAVGKGKEALYQRLEAAVQHLEGSDRYEQLYLKWFAKTPEYWTGNRVFMAVVAISAVLIVMLLLAWFWRYQSLIKLNAELQQANRYLEEADREVEKGARLLKETEQIGKIGSWELDLVTNHLTWSDQVFHIFEIDQTRFDASYEGFLNAIHPDDRALVNATYTESVENRTPYEIEHRLRMVDGSIKWVLERGISEYSEQGEPLLSRGMVQDITQQVQADRELRQAMEIKDEFLASMSHELRTPLTAILGYCDMLLEEQNGPEHIHYLKSIRSAGKGQLALVNDILDMSKIDSGKFTIEENAYDLPSLLQELEQMFRIRADDAGLSLSVVQKNREPFLLVGDSQRIGQVLINLIGNAIKFTEEGSVTLTTHVEEGKIFFTVEDSGIGMSPEVLDRLFSRFEQADGSISRRFGGSGLGLYISLNLAELMGGTIDVSSREGVGSIFQLILPYKSSDISEQDSGGSSQQKAVLEKRLSGHILLAEDTLMIQQLEKRILEKMGLQVTVANNGVEAVELATTQPFDVILMDMQMPQMDGIDACHELRTRGIRTPVIAVTANVMQKHRDAFSEAGCDGFIGKPINNGDLEKLLKKYL